MAFEAEAAEGTEGTEGEGLRQEREIWRGHGLPSTDL